MKKITTQSFMNDDQKEDRRIAVLKLKSRIKQAKKDKELHDMLTGYLTYILDDSSFAGWE